MSTSSIFASVIDEDPEAIKNIADVLEEAEKKGPREMTTNHPVMSPEDVDKFFNGTETIPWKDNNRTST